MIQAKYFEVLKLLRNTYDNYTSEIIVKEVQLEHSTCSGIIYACEV